MPGHALAALSAYPDLACTKGSFEPATKWGVFDDVFCPKDETFTFLENVLDEVIALFLRNTSISEAMNARKQDGKNVLIVRN
jgi:N-acetyl-beta-hexosaminidase